MFRDLAFLRFTVTDVATNHVTAQRVIPINFLRPGYRHVRLNNMQNQPLPLSSLFIFTKFEEEGVDLVQTQGQNPSSLGLTPQSKDNCVSLLGSSGSFTNALKDEPELESPTIKTSPVQEDKPAAEAPMKRRMFFLIVYGVQNVGIGLPMASGASGGSQRDDEPYVILTVTQDCTTETVIRKALSKISTSTASGGTCELQLHDYLLLEEVNRGWEPSDKLLPPLQRILDAKERPLEAQAKWRGEGRFILRRIGDDPSSRAWLSSILNSNQKMKSRKVHTPVSSVLDRS